MILNTFFNPLSIYLTIVSIYIKLRLINYVELTKYLLHSLLPYILSFPTISAFYFPVLQHWADSENLQWYSGIPVDGSGENR